MNTQQIAIFKFESNDLTTLTNDDGDPLFLAKDVAKILGYKDTEAMTRRLDDDEYLHLQFVGSGQGRKTLFLTESGLYSSILGSKIPGARPFRKIVTSEILPSIRKTGGYNQDRQIETLINEVQQIKSIILSLPAYKPANQEPALSQKEINAIKTDAFSKNAESAIIAYIENKGQCTRREMINSLRATQPFKSIGKGRTQLLHEYINKLKFANKIKISDESFFLLA